MSEHEVLSLEQWAIARKIFLAREKDFARLFDKTDAAKADAARTEARA